MDDYPVLAMSRHSDALHYYWLLTDAKCIV